MLPSWKPQYSVNHSGLDAQHKELFRLAAQVYGLDASAATKTKIRELLHGFYGYMQKHFTEEEAYMEAIGYPGIQEHRTQHQEIIDSLNGIIKKSHDLKEIRSSMRMMVRVWLVEHIMQHDMQYEKWRKTNRCEKVKNENMAKDEFGEI